MAHVIKPPTPVDFDDSSTFKIFLGGTIDMGNSFDWQADMAEQFKGMKDVLLMNPRREAWDSSWEQTISNPHFRGQVEWELECLEKADLILLNILPTSKSPISLLELGLFATTKRIIVCCPEPFYRKGNVDVVCARYGVTQVSTYEELVMAAQFMAQDMLYYRSVDAFLDEENKKNKSEDVFGV